MVIHRVVVPRDYCYGTMVRDSNYTLGGRWDDGRTAGRREDGGTTGGWQTAGGQWDDGRMVGRREDGGATGGRQDDGRTVGRRATIPQLRWVHTGNSGTRERERMMLLAKCTRRCVKEEEGT